MVPCLRTEFGNTQSPYHPTALEAIAATFALDVPRVALLILQASAPVRRAVYDLRSLGVNAHEINVSNAAGGGSFLLRKGTAPVVVPTLIVATLPTIRGIDLPDLTHVFILGFSKALTPDEYLHAAGRVGRFGRSGKVISILEEQRENEEKDGIITVKDEPRWLERLYKSLHVTPVRLEHFLQD